MRIVSTCLLCAATAVASGDISSTFDSDSEGWGVLNDATGFTWDGAIGNPSGAIRARDVGDGRIWYFAGSSMFTGNLGAYYGGSILWDNMGISGSHTSVTGCADVMLVGSAGSIGIDIAGHPVNDQWQTFSVALATGDWYMVSSQSNGTLSSEVASADVMRAVLADLTGFYIQGEYTNGGDSIALDNVVLELPTPSTMLAMLGAGLCAGRRRRSLVGTSRQG